MTYKLLRHKDFTAEWEKLPVAIRDQFKKKLEAVDLCSNIIQQCIGSHTMTKANATLLA